MKNRAPITDEPATPKHEGLAPSGLRTLRASIIIFGAAAIIGVMVLFAEADTIESAAWDGRYGPSVFTHDSKFQKFSNDSELRDFLSEVKWDYTGSLFPNAGYAVPHSTAFTTDDVWTGSEGGWFTLDGGLEVLSPQSASPYQSSRGDAGDHISAGDKYSTTNIQVRGVDEPDFVKNDGRYIYTLVGNELVIVDAYPADTARIVFESDFDRPEVEEGYLEMFLKGDRLAAIYESYGYKSVLIDDDGRRATAVQLWTTNVLVFDITERNSVRIVDEYVIDGRYHDARMIDGMVYIVTRSGLDYGNPSIPSVYRFGSPLLSPDVYYYGRQVPSALTTVTSLPIDGGPFTAQTYLMGDGDATYVSTNNMYLALGKAIPTPQAVFDEMQKNDLIRVLAKYYPDNAANIGKIATSDLPAAQKMEAIDEVVRDSRPLSDSARDRFKQEFVDESRKVYGDLLGDLRSTTIHKIGLPGTPGGAFEYKASATVAGDPINQFAMDEYDGMFRIATTIRDSQVHNAVYVLDDKMELVGSLEGIAYNETIYSARFAGETLYLVTFRQIDPFFVIDLSGGIPRILGELKIPGWSSYLHPYGDDSVIGIGRDGGIKIAIFDVSDFDNPRLKDEVIIGDHYSDSPGLDDHKAVFIDPGHGIISLPVNQHSGNGFYVYGIDEVAGFDERGVIWHDDSNTNRARTLYIQDALYTITDGLLKINKLGDVSRQLGSLVLN